MIVGIDSFNFMKNKFLNEIEKQKVGNMSIKIYKDTLDIKNDWFSLTISFTYDVVHTVRFKKGKKGGFYYKAVPSNKKEDLDAAKEIINDTLRRAIEGWNLAFDKKGVIKDERKSD